MNWALLFLFLLFFTLIVFRVPVALSLGLSALVGILIAGIDPVNAVSQLYRGLDSFVILAVPFFLAVGFLASRTSVSARILQLSAFATGWLRGAVGHLNVVTSMLFAGVSGSATADTSGVGSVLIPMMRQRGYSAGYAAALTAQTSVIGAIIPPSIIMIIYGATANISVGALFAAGVIPGAVCGVAYMVYNYFYAARHGIDRGHDAAAIGREVVEREAELGLIPAPGAAAREAAAPGDPGPGSGAEARAGGGRAAGVPATEPRTAGARAAGEEQEARGRPAWLEFAWLFGRALPSLLVPFILLAGITLGVFTATEAGAIALFYLVVLVVVFYRDLGLRGLLRTFRDAVQFYNLPLLAAGFATVFGVVVTILGGATLVRQIVTAAALPAVGYLFMVIVVFIVVGTFLDQFPAIVLFVPIFLEGAGALDIHPLHLGIVVIMTLALGYVTPPYGLCLLIAAKLAGIPVSNVTRALLPFWLITLGVITLAVLLPDVMLALPRLLYPRLFL